MSLCYVVLQPHCVCTKVLSVLKLFHLYFSWRDYVLIYVFSFSSPDALTELRVCHHVGSAARQSWPWVAAAACSPRLKLSAASRSSALALARRRVSFGGLCVLVFWG